MIITGLIITLILGVLGPVMADDADLDNSRFEVNHKYQWLFLSQTSETAKQLFTGGSITSQAEHVPLHTKLKGTWQNDLMKVSIDFEEGVYYGVALGEEFFRPLVLVREYANIVIFKTINSDKTSNTITCQIQDNGSILLTKEGGVPLIFKRVMTE